MTPTPRPVRLSVNINKVATLRNSRGGRIPDLIRAARACVDSGADGITVHPRADERHVTATDVRELKAAFAGDWGPKLELNIEGDPRPDWLDLVCEIAPEQATLVPVAPGEITSHVGWGAERDIATVDAAVARLKSAGCRVSLFVEPDAAAVRWAHERGADRIELYTEPFAQSFEQGHAAAEDSFNRYAQAATLAQSLGLGVNAGHDLDLQNLEQFATLPHLDEVSIGHALISDALFRGLATVVADYLSLLRQ